MKDMIEEERAMERARISLASWMGRLVYFRSSGMVVAVFQFEIAAFDRTGRRFQ